MPNSDELPPNVERALEAFVQASRAALGDDLRALVLYGSAAEQRLRATSDVNLIVVLAAFDPAKLDGLREPLRTAHAAIRLSPMFLLEREVSPAMEAFAVKFADVLRRRRLLYGRDPFADLRPSRAAEIAQLRQVLLNLALRLRQQYMLRSLREEQAALLVAETAGPLRSCAAALAELGGHPAPSAREALADVGGARFSDVVTALSRARETGLLPAGAAAPTLLGLLELIETLQRQVERLDPGPA
jgi:predicted nucleotidyltransferase